MATYTPGTGTDAADGDEPERVNDYQRAGYEDYRDYIDSPEWRIRRKLKIAQAGRRCQLCNCSSNLRVHHRTYERCTDEHPEDLTVLCLDCHDAFHATGRRYDGDTHTWVKK